MIALIPRPKKTASIHAPKRIAAWLFFTLAFALHLPAISEASLGSTPDINYRDMQPVRLVKCDAMLREAVNFSNLGSYSSGFGEGDNLLRSFRFVMTRDEMGLPRVYFLRHGEAHEEFVENSFVRDADGAAVLYSHASTIEAVPGILYESSMDEPDSQDQARFSIVSHGSNWMIFTKEEFAEVVRAFARGLNIVKPDDIFAYIEMHVRADGSDVNTAAQPTQTKTSVSSQVYRTGWAAGRMVYLGTDDIMQAYRSGQINSADILVVEHAPQDLPPIAGLITLNPGVRNSHAEMLAGMLRIPYLYLSQDQLAEYRRFFGSFVVLNVRSNVDAEGQWSILPVSPDEARRLNANNAKPHLDLQAPDIEFTNILPLHDLLPGESQRFGAKASNLSFALQALGKKHTPAGLAVPFAYFAQYLKTTRLENSTLWDLIQSKLTRLMDGESPPSYLETAEILESIHQLIMRHEVPDAILAPIAKAMQEFAKSNAIAANGRFLLRSSSNAEDLNGFNGAGLYGSALMDSGPNATLEQFMGALNRPLRNVWASVFNLRAYYTRRLFHINEHNLGMAVLIHPEHEPQRANGVTTLEWKGAKVRVVHSLLPGNDELVTSPSAGVTAEVIEFNFDIFGYEEMLRISETNLLPSTTPALSTKELRTLNLLLRRLVPKWNNLPEGHIDIEWYLPRREGARFIIRQTRDVVEGTNIIPENFVRDGDHAIAGLFRRIRRYFRR